MASIANRSRFRVAVKHRAHLTKHFSFNQRPAVEAYVSALREQGYEPHAEQLDDCWQVRIRHHGGKAQSATFSSLRQAKDFAKHIEEEHRRGVFIDYGAAYKVSLAELLVRYLLEESPRHKRHPATSSRLEGWLADSGPAGTALLETYREKLREQGRTVRKLKPPAAARSDAMAWIHKPLADITAADIQTFITRRLGVVGPDAVNRDIDRLKVIYKVAMAEWNYALAMNPMDVVRRPKPADERDRRVSADEERRLLDALATLDVKRAVEERLTQLVDESLVGQTFGSASAHKKALAGARAQLRPQAEATAKVVPYLEVFYRFQVGTGARRAETLDLTWACIDFGAQTALVTETGDRRPRRLVLRRDLLAWLDKLPRDTPRVFGVGAAYIATAWAKACRLAGIRDLRIEDVRHEALSRLAEGGQVSFWELVVLCGRRNVRQLMRYARLYPWNLARKLDESLADDMQVRGHQEDRFLNQRANGSASDKASLPDGSESESALHAPALPRASKVMAFASPPTNAS
jgi:integrase